MKVQEILRKRKEEKIRKNREAGTLFLENNLKNPNVQMHEFGFQYIIHNAGEGDTHPYHSCTVTCHYRGKTIDGKEFDSSYKRNKPASFPLSHVIKGWQIGIPLMKKGAHFTFYFPPELAYGDDQVGSDIEPGSTLIFDVELLDFK